MYGIEDDSELEAVLKTYRRDRSWEPTREALLKHQEKFGSECIEQTAAQYGIDLSESPGLAQSKSKRRKTTPALIAEVLKLHEKGMVLTAIADALNLSDARVKRIISAEGK